MQLCVMTDCLLPTQFVEVRTPMAMATCWVNIPILVIGHLYPALPRIHHTAPQLTLTPPLLGRHYSHILRSCPFKSAMQMKVFWKALGAVAFCFCFFFFPHTRSFPPGSSKLLYPQLVSLYPCVTSSRARSVTICLSSFILTWVVSTWGALQGELFPASRTGRGVNSVFTFVWNKCCRVRWLAVW